MTRESKNNNDGAVFTYHERRNIPHRTQHLRLPSAALKPWHHCALRLSSPQTPVLTPQGILYDRQAILLNLLQQNQQIRADKISQQAKLNRLQLQHDRNLQKRRREQDARFAQRQQEIIVLSPPHSPEKQVQNHMTKPNFWLPGSDHPRDTNITQPTKRRKKDSSSMRTVCPVTGKPLKSRDLITLKPTHVEKQHHSHTHDNDSQLDSTASSHDKSFICPVCQTALVNSARPVALRTGTIICKRCVDDFVRKDARDPVLGNQLDLHSDIIEIQNSGTAFAASSSDNPASKEAKLYRPTVR